jgi:hypothetical protein
MKQISKKITQKGNKMSKTQTKSPRLNARAWFRDADGLLTGLPIDISGKAKMSDDYRTLERVFGQYLFTELTPTQLHYYSDKTGHNTTTLPRVCSLCVHATACWLYPRDTVCDAYSVYDD